MVCTANLPTITQFNVHAWLWPKHFNWTPEYVHATMLDYWLYVVIIPIVHHTPHTQTYHAHQHHIERIQLNGLYSDIKWSLGRSGYNYNKWNFIYISRKGSKNFHPMNFVCSTSCTYWLTYTLDLVYYIVDTRYSTIRTIRQFSSFNFNFIRLHFGEWQNDRRSWTRCIGGWNEKKKKNTREFELHYFLNMTFFVRFEWLKKLISSMLPARFLFPRHHSSASSLHIAHIFVSLRFRSTCFLFALHLAHTIHLALAMWSKYNFILLNTGDEIVRKRGSHAER